MASKATQKLKIPEGELERYRFDPRAFIEEVLWILDRDQAGVAVPFKLRPIQAAFLEEIQRRRAFNIWRSIKRIGKAAIDILAKEVTKKPPTNTRSAIKAIVAAKPDRVLSLFPPEMKIDDGPVAFIIGKPRQVGFSTLIEAIIIWRAVFHPNMKAILMAHEGDSVENVLKISKDFIRLWPEEKAALRPEVPRNATTKVVFENGATLTIKTAGGLESRGFKEDIGHFSEFAHYPNGSSVAASLIAAPKHFWYFIESTANGKSGNFYEFYQKSTTVDALIELYDAGKALPQRTTTKFFIDWRQDPEYKLPLDPGDEEHIKGTMSEWERMAVETFDLSLEQLKWRRWKLENAAETSHTLNPEAFFAQEFPLTEDEMFQQLGGEVFDANVIATARAAAAANPPRGYFSFDGASPPKPSLTKAGSNLRVWEPPRKDELYVIGADPAFGLQHRDFCWGSVFAIGDGTVIRQVAEFIGQGPQVNQATFAHSLVTLAEWYNNAFIVPEANQGLTLCDTIVMGCGYTNVYARKPLDSIPGEQNSFRFGFATTGASRPRLLEEFIEAFRTGAIIIRSTETLDQMAIFTRNELGKMAAPDGKHDDAVFAAALANFGFPSSRGGPSLVAARLRRLKEPEPQRPEQSTADAHEERLLQSIEKMVSRERSQIRKEAKSGLASGLILL